MIQVSLLGSTGSIGCQTLEVASRHPEKIKILALAAGKSVEKLAEQARAFNPSLVAVPDGETAARLKALLGKFSGEISFGPEALLSAASFPASTHVVVAVVGSLGLRPTLKALELGKTVALANKEALVAGGHLVKNALEKHGGALIPVDSEHSAIFQCLRGEKVREVSRIFLTASGGPFRGWNKEKLSQVTKEQVLAHPVWKMGNKITVDSASLMNKGLEVIEAKWLFGLSPDQIQIVVHPQGIIHSMVEFVDGSVIAQLGLPDMRTPIQFALSFPDRFESPPPRLEPALVGTLTFEEADRENFPAVGFAYDAAEAGGSLPAVLNAANEEAVGLFLADRISFSEIPEIIRPSLSKHQNNSFPSLEEVLEADLWARNDVKEQARVKSS